MDFYLFRSPLLLISINIVKSMQDHVNMVLYMLLIPLHAHALVYLCQTVHIHEQVKVDNRLHIRDRVEDILHIHIEAVLIHPDIVLTQDSRLND